MAVYNGADHIREALTSLLAQRFTDFELVISDNGSTDETPRICEELAARDARVRLVRQPVNLGPARNFAFVLEAARAPYFMFAAHDDLWDPTFIERLVGELDRRPEAVLAFSRWDAINQLGRHIRDFAEDWGAILTGDLFRRIHALVTLDESETLKALFYYGLMRREVWLEEFTWGNAYDAYAGSDMLMVVTMAGRGEFAFVDEVLFHNRIRPLRKRSEESIARYVAARATGTASGHRGSAWAMLRRTHEYRSGLRDAIRRIAGLRATERGRLVLLTYLREWRGYLVDFPAAVLRELGVLKPPSLARAAEG